MCIRVYVRVCVCVCVCEEEKQVENSKANSRVWLLLLLPSDREGAARRDATARVSYIRIRDSVLFSLRRKNGRMAETKRRAD